MTKFPKIDLTGIRTVSIADRPRKIEHGAFAQPLDPATDSFSVFVDSLPNILVARDLRDFVEHVVTARREGRPVVWMMGAHVIKVGLAPIVNDLMRRGLITSVAMNSASCVHDVETARFGTTSEDVAENIRDGSFGMSRETGEFINGTLTEGMRENELGFGEAIGRRLSAATDAPYKQFSITATGYDLHIPVSVHAAIGTDIVHQQPSMNGAATGEMSFRDFRLLCTVLCDIRGGVVINVGSAVIMPEVFLKALTVARNLGHDAFGFVTANFDMIQHYRPRMNVVERPTQAHGRGFQFTGHHEIMIPLLAAMLTQRWEHR
jgi:hypothetical protein